MQYSTGNRLRQSKRMRIGVSQYLAPTPFEKNARDGLLKKIELAVTQMILEASVAPYGSYESQLLLPSRSDIDVRIQATGWHPKFVLQKVKKHIQVFHNDAMHAEELVLQAVVCVFSRVDVSVMLSKQAVTRFPSCI
ncbi:hypothetical protein BJV82DRAFT_576317 [Fennellomyces sp. T-0311]|nr:hypothetical protein BJV82DRAFT_576317 [Fennellomyces sp. T-0311]